MNHKRFGGNSQSVAVCFSFNYEHNESKAISCFCTVYESLNRRL